MRNAAFFVLMLVSLSGLTTAYACQPPRFDGTPEEQAAQLVALPQLLIKTAADQMVADADVILIGTVTASRLIEAPERTGFAELNWNQLPARFVSVRVSTTLRGTQLGTADILYGAFGSMCALGPSLDVGEEVLVSAKSKDGHLVGDVHNQDIPLLIDALRQRGIIVKPN